MTTLPNHQIRSAMGASSATNPSTNWAALAIGLARVKEVQYEELKCTLVILTGEADICEYTGVDITVPCGGKRHFFGALPERGDICYVGWGVRESAGTASAKSPIILGWAPAAPWMGHEWIPHQAMERGEGMDTPSDRAVTSGTFERSRFKMRHLAPGNVFASSSQGSDLVLDENVLLTNRRGNEIRLRDADQAIVLRSLQQFHAMAGARVYSGMVQREARLLPSTLFSDGIYWENSPQTLDDSTPRPVNLLGDDTFPRGFLTPAQIFTRDPGAPNSRFGLSRGTGVSARLDPFSFLQWGGYIDAQGYRTESNLPGGTSNTIYGGKALYRVGLRPDGRLDNAISPKSNTNVPPTEALTEYRVEVSHTSDGLLPVTEQTDGFDSERLPSAAPTDGNPMSLGKQPFIEMVYGSVVGNDPFSFIGRTLYGIPLRAQVLDASGNVSPGTLSALTSPLGEHAATLFRLVPPVPGPNGTTTASFTSFTKDGRFKAYIAGGPVSAEVATAGDLALSVGGVLHLNLTGGVSINGASGPGGVGLNLGSATGAVVISGGGAVDSNSAAQAVAPDAIGNATPSVIVDGTQGVAIRSDRNVNINATDSINLANTGAINVNAQNQVSIRSGQNVSLSAVTHSVIVSGSETVNYSGPENANPANGPTRRVTFSSLPATGNLGGTVDKYHMVYGNREEQFDLGSHSTRIGVGDLAYETLQGRWRMAAGANSFELDSLSGSSHTVAVGNHSTVVATGAFSATAQTDVTIRAVTGNATVFGAQAVKLASPVGAAVTAGGPPAFIVCGGDLDPLTGIPLATFIQPRGQKLSAI